MSTANPMLLTKDEATAAQRTMLFHLTNTADGTDATGKTLSGADIQISKAGAAFANAAGAAAEIANGWYAFVFAAADLDTLGQLAVEINESGCDPVRVVHQVTALDLNTATVAIGAGGIPVGAFAAGAITADAIATDAIGSAELAATAASEIRTGLATAAALSSITLATRTVNYDLGTIDDDGSTGSVSILDAVSATVTVTGTWDSAEATVEVCDNPKASPQVWTAYSHEDNPLDDDGSITITEPHSAVRVTVASAGASTDLAVAVAIRKPVGA